MIKSIVAAAALALLPLPALAQATQAPLQQQVDAAQGEINRVVTSMANLIIQQNAEIIQLQNQLKHPEPQAALKPGPPPETK